MNLFFVDVRCVVLLALVPAALTLACGGERPTFGAPAGASTSSEASDANSNGFGPVKGTGPIASQFDLPTLPTDGGSTLPSGSDGNPINGTTGSPTTAGTTPDAPPPGCGNGKLESDEQCDSGEQNSDTQRGVCGTHCKINMCGQGETRSCAQASALGNCTLGSQHCEAGQWTECDIAAAAMDSCEPGDDASCNGTANEGCGCSIGQMVSCAANGAKGACAKGQAVCGEDGQYGDCSIEAEAADACDVPGDDSNCNGVPNEGCDCSDGDKQPCGVESDEGECAFGESVCAGGQWGECQGAVLPGPRDCSSTKDNDCDGKPDNTIDDVCACAPGESEACDEHPGLDGNGDCKAGTRACVVSADKATSRWAEACTGAIGPQGEDSCTEPGDDADCDGEENGGCACLAGQASTCGARWGYEGTCAEYTLACSNAGEWPAEETACQAKGNDSCAAPGECIGGIWDDEAVAWDEACWD